MSFSYELGFGDTVGLDEAAAEAKYHLVSWLITCQIYSSIDR